MDEPNERSEQGDRRIAFYSNLERYYRKLYERAKQRAARLNSAWFIVFAKECKYR